MRWQFFYALEIKFFLINSYGNFSYLIKVNLGFFCAWKRSNINLIYKIIKFRMNQV